MERINKQVVYRIIALVLLGVFVVPIFMNQAVMRTIDESEMTSAGEEQLLTEQIGNMTGASTKEIEALRRNGYSWTEVLEKLQDERDGMRSADGVVEDGAYEKILIAQGIALSDIQDVKMAITNLSMLLDEIVQSEEAISVEPNTVVVDAKPEVTDNDETTAVELCQSIVSQMDEDYLLYLVFQLKEVLPDTNDVINEYLYALQVGLDIEIALENYDAYQEQKASQWIGTEVLTVQDINILAIQRMNTRNKQVIEDSGESMNTEHILESPQVVNPADAIRDELDALNPNK